MGAANDPPLTADQVRSEDDEKSYFGSDNDVSIRFDSSQDYLVFENEDTGEVWVFDSNGEVGVMLAQRAADWFLNRQGEMFERHDVPGVNV